MTTGRRSWPLRGLDRLPIRWRLAAVSASLTGVILLLFAVTVGSVTARLVEGDFTTQTAARFEGLRQRIDLRQGGPNGLRMVGSALDAAADAGSVVKIWSRNIDGSFTPVAGTPDADRYDIGGPDDERMSFGTLRVATRSFQQPVNDEEGQPIAQGTTLQFPQTGVAPGLAQVPRTLVIPGPVITADLVVRLGRSYDATQRTTRRVWTALGVGVLAGTLLALVAGLALGARAMRPVRRMTSTARHIARTRDLEAKMPTSPVQDEIAELSGTLQDMLDELAAAQATVDATLQRQREFIADASHELRTPLTSVQANLELLALSTTGDDHEAAESALRSARRMRRLVGDLLLLARMDASRDGTRTSVDLDRVVLEAVDELEPQAGDHEIALDLEPVTVEGLRDELVRMVANLVGNALRYTPAGTEIRVRLRRVGGTAELVVEDDGPGVAPDMRERVFARFVRSGGEAAGSTGIGLAIVRSAAQRHGGDVRVEATHPKTDTGARFVVTVRADADAGASARPDAADAGAGARPDAADAGAGARPDGTDGAAGGADAPAELRGE